MTMSRILTALTLPVRLIFILLAALFWATFSPAIYLISVIMFTLIFIILTLPIGVAIWLRFQTQTSNPGISSVAANYLMNFGAVSKTWNFIFLILDRSFPLVWLGLGFILTLIWYSFLFFTLICFTPAYLLLRWPLQPLWWGYQDWSAVRAVAVERMKFALTSLWGFVADVRYEYLQGEWRNNSEVALSLWHKLFCIVDFALEQAWLIRLSRSVLAHARELVRRALQNTQTHTETTLRSTYIPSVVKFPLAVLTLVIALVGDALKGNLVKLWGFTVDSTHDWGSRLHETEQNVKREKNQTIYTSLVSSAEIRLLRIHPGVEGKPLECSVYTEARSSARYQALSYVWGDPTLERFITLNGTSYAVGKNLYDCLLRLRRHDGECQLWVDALCINQADSDERSEQVIRMGEIYRRAERVVIWLGPDVPGLQKVFCQVYPQHDAAPNDTRGAESTDVICYLLSSPWWSRVWTVQELFLGNSVVVQCGRHNLAWDSFCEVIDSHTNHIKSSDLANTSHQQYSALRRERRLFKAHARRRYPLLEYIYIYRGKGATHVVDKIFGFYGLLDDASVEIRPEYSDHPSNVQETFAIDFINRYKSLAVIAMAEVPRSDDGSDEDWWWCPQWRRDGRTSTRTLFWTGLGDEIGQQPWSEEAFDTARGQLVRTKCEMVGHPYNYVVALEGWRADKVVFSSAEMTIEDVDEPRWNMLTEQWLTMIRNWETDHGSRPCGTMLQLFYRTITAGQFDEDQLRESPRHAHFVAVRREACRGRRLFVTSSGYYGLGPPDAAAGDEVWILLGMAVPVILHQRVWTNEKCLWKDTTETFAYLGQAYVDELMNAREKVVPVTTLPEDMLETIRIGPCIGPYRKVSRKRANPENPGVL